ncbi:MAG: GC-type dockerin domain-anchored protein [Phycisphaerales bacterium]
MGTGRCVGVLRRALVALLAVLLGAAAVRADDYYVQAQTGDDSNPGTAAFPLRTLHSLESRLGPGDTAYLSGRFTDSAFFFGPQRVTIRQWPGFPQAEITNSRRVGYWLPAGDAYVSNVGPDLDITAVSVRWGDPLIKDQYGRDKTFLVYSPDPATPYSWNYSPASGWLSINLGGEDPTAGRHALYPVEYCLGSPVWIGLNLEQASECVIDGLHFRHSIGSETGTYGLKVGGRNNIIRNCKSWHISWHHLTFVGSGNDACEGNLMQDCECWGFGFTSTANMVTLYSTFHDVRANRIERVHLHVYQMLRYDTGEPIYPRIGLDGFYSHTGGGGGATVYDNQWTDCRVDHYENPGAPIGIGDASLDRVPAEGSDAELDWTQWPNRVVGGTFTGLRAIGTASETAYSRCVFICQNFGIEPNSYGLFNYIGIPGERALLLDACYIGFDAAGPGYKGVFVYRRTPTQSLRLNILNTTFFQFSPDAQNPIRLIWMEGSSDVGQVRMIGSVVDLNQGDIAALVFNDSSLSAQRLEFRGNFYGGIEPSSYSSAPARATREGWQAIDPPSVGAVYGTPARLLDPLVSARPQPGTDLAVRRWYQSVHSPLGVNGLPYNSHYGAWQSDDPCLADFNGDTFVNSQDAFDFLSAFFALEPASDINHDGFINTQDFFDFLVNFYAGC